METTNPQTKFISLGGPYESSINGEALPRITGKIAAAHKTCTCTRK